MIGAGGQAGQSDAANLLKPALARGELRTIAATTWSEYKKYFEKDPALARRFQVVKVEEPTKSKCLVMLRGVVPMLEKHHNVRILDEGSAAAVKLSHRYLPGRQLPDKAVSVLDTACARLALGQNTIPPAIEDAQREIDDCAVQTRVLEREARWAPITPSGSPPSPSRRPPPKRIWRVERAMGKGARPGRADSRSARQDGGRTASGRPAGASSSRYSRAGS